MFFDEGMECQGELGPVACVADGATVQPPAPPTNHPHGKPPSGSGGALSCSSNDEFAAAFAPVNVECCDGPTEDCSAGFPATCDAGCAALLLPAQAACEDFLAAGGMLLAGTKAMIDQAAALCPPPLPACSSNDEFAAAFAPANVECCDGPTEDCSAGFPATCDAGCAAVLLPAQAACEDFLAAGGMLMAGTKSQIDAAAARCPGGGGGH